MNSVLSLFKYQQKNRSFSLGNVDAAASGEANGSDSVTPSPMSKLQMGHAHSMLMKLVSESDSKSVAFTEEVSHRLLWRSY